MSDLETLAAAVWDFIGSCTEVEGTYPPPKYEFDPKAWPEYTKLLKLLDKLGFGEDAE